MPTKRTSTLESRPGIFSKQDSVSVQSNIKQDTGAS